MSVPSSPGRRVVITGAPGGIGRHLAAAFAAQGYRLALCGSSADSVARATQGLPDAQGYAEDLAAPAAVDALSAAILSDGPVDVLIHAAGGSRPEPFLQMDPAKWDALIAVNYAAFVRLSHAFLPGMVERGHGRLIAIGSDAGRAGSKNEAVYAGAKAALGAFSKSIAAEFGRAGVTVNVVSPGPTETELLEEFRAKHPEATEKLRRRVPIGRFAQPEEIAATALFLASDGAAAITGQIISVNGGLHMA